jgi:hypothetical protein
LIQNGNFIFVVMFHMICNMTWHATHGLYPMPCYPMVFMIWDENPYMQFTLTFMSCFDVMRACPLWHGMSLISNLLLQVGLNFELGHGWSLLEYNTMTSKAILETVWKWYKNKNKIIFKKLKVLEWSFIKIVVTIVIHDAILALKHLQQAHNKLIQYLNMQCRMTTLEIY